MFIAYGKNEEELIFNSYLAFSEVFFEEEKKEKKEHKIKAKNLEDAIINSIEECLYFFDAFGKFLKIISVKKTKDGFLINFKVVNGKLKTYIKGVSYNIKIKKDKTLSAKVILDV